MRSVIIGHGRGEHAWIWKLAQSRRSEEIACIPGNGGIATLAACLPLVDLDVMAQVLEQTRPDMVWIGNNDALRYGFTDAMADLHLAAPCMDSAACELIRACCPLKIPARGYCIHGFADGEHIFWSPLTWHDTDPAHIPDNTDAVREEILRVATTTGDALLQTARRKQCRFQGAFRFHMLVREGLAPVIAAAVPGMDDADAQVLLPMLTGELPDFMEACGNGTLAESAFAWQPGGCACVLLNRDEQAEAAPIQGLRQLSRQTATFFGDVEAADGHLLTAGAQVMGVVCRAERSADALTEALTEADKLTYPGRLAAGFTVIL